MREEHKEELRDFQKNAYHVTWKCCLQPLLLHCMHVYILLLHLLNSTFLKPGSKMGSDSITKMNQYPKRKELGLMKMELNSKIRTNVTRYTVECCLIFQKIC